MKKNKTINARIITFIFFLFLSAIFFTITTDSRSPGSDYVKKPPGTWYLDSETDRLLDDTFRIDIRNITTTFDYFPSGSYADCLAVVEFFMRPGQQRPLIHLGPAIRDTGSVRSIRLNEEMLDISKTSDARVVSFDGTRQQALEFQRNLDQNRAHKLEISYRLNLPKGYPRFSTEVNDYRGRGNEERFPTINTPHELARHVLYFRVHGDAAYRCIGSGLVEELEAQGNVRQWHLDTEREVASYTVMFFLAPEEDTVFRERDIDGVKVRVMAFKGGASIDDAFSVLNRAIPELQTNLGPFPMPRGISIFLLDSGGGMEYYGGTFSSVWALKHELFHMYFGCSTINRTYRDSWLDEAINIWYAFSPAKGGFPSIESTYRSNIAGGRSPIGLGFDLRAYSKGARIMEAVAQELGGRAKMIAFLRHLYRTYSFKPFTTQGFLAHLKAYSGVDMTDRFLDWAYMKEETTPPAGVSSRKRPRLGISQITANLTPPAKLLKKYGLPVKKKK
ncbi:MAG: M1 family metallopeptidase [bacterium]|nr:M1 family metallopeptidase [bacterium]